MGNDNDVRGATLSAGIATVKKGKDYKQVNVRQCKNGWIINVHQTMYGPSEEHIAYDKQAIIEIIENEL